MKWPLANRKATSRPHNPRYDPAQEKRCECGAFRFSVGDSTVVTYSESGTAVFFSFDGIDGAGKSTQLKLFVYWLREQGHDVVTCRDPGTTQLGEAVRAILLGADYRFDYRAEMLLYMACRAQLVQEVIRPAIDQGKVVVSDRFVLANVVYQGSAGGIEPDEIWRVGKIATENLLPDMTFVLDLPLDVAAARLGEQQDRMEARGRDYFEKVRRGFLEQAARFPDTNVVVDASQDIDEIQQQIQAAARRLVETP